MFMRFRAFVICFTLTAALTAHADDQNSDEDKVTLDTIKAGRLARYGITAGLALTVNTSYKRLDSSVHGWNTGSMAYIEGLPLVNPLILGDISRAYCVARHTAQNAQDIADAVAFERSGLEITNLKQIDNISDQDIMKIIESQGNKNPDISAIATFRSDYRAHPDAIVKVVKKFVKDGSNWTPGVPGSRCWTTAFGIYIGIPSSFNLDVDFTSKNKDGMYEDHSMRRNGELKPIYSVGLTISPISEVRLMVGATRSNVLLKEDGTNARVWTLTLALGGNLDIAGALLSR